MLIAHITDTHVVTAGARAYRDQVDTNAMLERAIDRLNALTPRPDCVIITGDLTDHGRLGEYAELTRQLGRLEIPYYLVIGNHDDRDTMLAAVDLPYLHDAGRFVQYSVDHLPVRLVMLDSTSEAHHMGRILRGTLRLAESSARGSSGTSHDCRPASSALRYRHCDDGRRR